MVFNPNDYVVGEFLRRIGNINIFQMLDKNNQIDFFVSDGEKTIKFEGPKKDSEDYELFKNSLIDSLEKGNFNSLFNLSNK